MAAPSHRAAGSLLRWAGAGLAALATLAAQPAAPPAGDLRIWGSPADAALIQDWAAHFEALYPGIHVTQTLHGPESAMMGVYTDVADLALMGREMRQPAEMMAFTWAWRYPPTLVQVANAGAGSPRAFTSLAVLVSRANPIAQLTLAQLDGIYGAEHLRGAANVRTWGEAGATGAWRERPIHAVGPAIDSIPALFFRHAVLADSYKWNADLTETPDPAALVATLTADPSAIGYGPLDAATAAVKAVPLVPAAGGPAVPLTDATVAARTYPLTRVVTVVINRRPGAPVAPRTLAFLRFILGPEGQAAIGRDGGYVPLRAGQAAAELRKIQ